MSRIIPVLLLLALAACGGAKSPLPPAPAPTGMGEMRSVVGYDLARLKGDWVQVAGNGCAQGRLNLALGPQGWQAKGGTCQAGDLSGPVQIVGPGRLHFAGQPEPLWLVWADYDGRTMVLAPPSRRFAVIMDRGRISPDRMKAAKQMLAFNGFDPRQLVE